MNKVSCLTMDSVQEPKHNIYSEDSWVLIGASIEFLLNALALQ